MTSPERDTKVPYGYCHCGCGGQTKRSPRNRYELGIRKGEPAKYLPNHHNLLSVEEFIEDPETHCWVWQRAGNGKGYGKIHHSYAHRVYYELYVGPIPDGLQLDHLCRNRACVNPGHLEPVTARENLLRGDTLTAENAAKTHCPKGHPYSGDNVYHSRHGRRCRACDREAHRKVAA